MRKRAAELDMDDVTAVLATLGDSPRDLRDAALFSIASDSLCRESGLVATEVPHLHLNRRRNTWSLLVPFSNTNQDGEAPDYHFVSHKTVARVRALQATAGLDEGLLVRPVGGRPKLAEDASPALLSHEATRIFQRRALAVGLDGVAAVSEQSARDRIG